MLVPGSPVQQQAGWPEHAHRALRAHGHRVGTARERVIDCLSARGLSTPQQLARELATGADRIAVSSIYRSLAALVDAGALREVDLGGVAHFDPIEPTSGGGRYLVCRSCGRTATFESAGADAAIAAAARDLGYDVWGEDLVAQARCGACAAADGAPA